MLCCKVVAGGFTLLSVDLTSTFTPYTARFNASSTEVDVELVFSGWSLVDLVSLVCMDKVVGYAAYQADCSAGTCSFYSSNSSSTI